MSSAQVGRWIVSVVFLLAAPAAAQPVTVVDTFAAGDRHGNSAYAIHNFSSDDLRHAVPIVPRTDLFLDAIDMGIAARFDPGQRLTLIVADERDGTVGEALETFTLTGLPVAVRPDEHHPPVRVVSESRPVLLEGRRYWLAASVPDVGNLTDVRWYTNSIGARGASAARGSGYDAGYGPGWHTFENQTLAAYRVLGTPVPEPGAGAVAVGLLTALFSMRRRRGRPISRV